MRCQQVYYSVDIDRSGTLDLNELGRAMQAFGFQLDMSPQGSFYSFLKSYDFDKSGRFDINIFIAMYVALSNAARVHARIQPMAPQLTFDLYVWGLAQL